VEATQQSELCPAPDDCHRQEESGIPD
jgi:hypothetical protein